MAIHLVQVHGPPRGGGCTRGVLAERFKTPLVGGVARLWRLGGNLPAPAFPGGETGKGSSDSLRPTGQSPPRLTAESVVRHPPRKSLLPLKSRNSQKVFGWLGESSHEPEATEGHLDPPFNSLEDLKMRFKRLQLEVSITESAAHTATLRDIERLLHSSWNLAELQNKIRQMEIDLGFEKNLQPPLAKRSRGVSGD